MNIDEEIELAISEIDEEIRLRKKLKRILFLENLKKNPIAWKQRQYDLKIKNKFYREVRKLKDTELSSENIRKIKARRLRIEIKQNPDKEKIRRQQSKIKYRDSISTPEKREKRKIDSDKSRNNVKLKTLTTPYKIQEQRSKSAAAAAVRYLNLKKNNPVKHKIILHKIKRQIFKNRVDEATDHISRYIRLLKKQNIAKQGRAREQADPARKLKLAKSKSDYYYRTKDKIKNPILPKFFDIDTEKKRLLTIKELEILLKIDD